jgi:hypothetical protein
MSRFLTKETGRRSLLAKLASPLSEHDQSDVSKGFQRSADVPTLPHSGALLAVSSQPKMSKSR